jgi:hypothetical protein
MITRRLLSPRPVVIPKMYTYSASESAKAIGIVPNLPVGLVIPRTTSSRASSPTRPARRGAPARRMRQTRVSGRNSGQYSTPWGKSWLDRYYPIINNWLRFCCH